LTSTSIIYEKLWIYRKEDYSKEISKLKRRANQPRQQTGYFIAMALGSAFGFRRKKDNYL
jgi:hypothetical protein